MHASNSRSRKLRILLGFFRCQSNRISVLLPQQRANSGASQVNTPPNRKLYKPFYLSVNNFPHSEQQLVDCSRAQGNYGCDGGWMHYAWDYLMQNSAGLQKLADYPYTQQVTNILTSVFLFNSTRV